MKPFARHTSTQLYMYTTPRCLTKRNTQTKKNVFFQIPIHKYSVLYAKTKLRQKTGDEIYNFLRSLL